MSLLKIEDLSVSFCEERVVDGVSFALDRGEKLALVGESGSGKTVTALSILRLLENARLGGGISFDGADVLAMRPAALRALRGGDCAMIFQEPMTALNPVLTVGAQIIEALQEHRGLDARAARAQAIAALHKVGVLEPERRVDSYAHQLSGGQRQRAMIAMALACEPKLLIADEPTTALDVTIRYQILALLDELVRERDLAVLMITHDLNLVRRFATRVLVMERGVLVEQGEVERVMHEPAHPYTRRLIDSRPRREVTAPGREEVLTARGVRVEYPIARPGLAGIFRKGRFVAVTEATFELRTGATLGVIGESGSGKTSLGLALLDLAKFTGEVSIEGRSWRSLGRAEQRALRQKVQVVFQDPFSSLSPRLTIEQIVGEGLTIHAPKLDAAARRARVVAALADVGLGDGPALELLLPRYPHEFSGGQRQRIAIARALIVEPRLVVLDEPTSSLDVTIAQQVLSLLARLQRKYGLAYVLVTHDIEVVRAMAHEVMVMKDGRVVELGPIEQVLTTPRSPYTRELVAS